MYIFVFRSIVGRVEISIHKVELFSINQRQTNKKFPPSFIADVSYFIVVRRVARIFPLVEYSPITAYYIINGCKKIPLKKFV